MKMIEINDSQFEAVVMKSALPVLVECTSPDCIICKTMAARIHEAGKDYLAKMAFFSFNINENKRWQNFGVRVIPTLLYFKDGILVARQDKFPDTDEIREMIKKITSRAAETINISTRLRAALDSEHAAVLFYKYVAAAATNGKVKEKFRQMQQESANHKELLQAKLKELTGESYASQAAKFDKAEMRPQSFSTLGALKMSIKIEEKLLDFYKRLKKENVFPDKGLLKKLIKEEASHRKGLEREMRFAQDKELFSAMESPNFPSWLNREFE